ncbi:hypothetical protein [Streptomyces sp. NRRL F-2664]|nr:hypothetical protein [Streptomyces sp. NRRL F-2664]
MFKTTLRQLFGALAVTVLATLGVIAGNESAEREEVVVIALKSDSQWG